MAKVGTGGAQPVIQARTWARDRGSPRSRVKSSAPAAARPGDGRLLACERGSLPRLRPRRAELSSDQRSFRSIEGPARTQASTAAARLWAAQWFVGSGEAIAPRRTLAHLRLGIARLSIGECGSTRGPQAGLAAPLAVFIGKRHSSEFLTTTCPNLLPHILQGLGKSAQLLAGIALDSSIRIPDVRGHQ